MLRRARHAQVNESWCAAHDLAPAAAHCRKCHRGYCTLCLVYPFGMHRQPYCAHCALVAAGIRRA